MKKKFLRLVLTIILIVTTLMILVGCEDKDKNKNKEKEIELSNVKSTIEIFIEAVNEKDEEKICDMIDLETLEKVWDEEFDKKEFKKFLEDFFDEYYDLEIEANKIECLDDDAEVMDDLFLIYSYTNDEYINSYDEYIKKSEDENDIKHLLIYTTKLDVSEEYEDLFKEHASIRGKDVIYLTEDNGEYKIVYTYFMSALYDDYMGEKAIKYLTEYEGKQSGETVKEVLDYIVENTTYNYSLYANYYGRDEIFDEYMLNTELEIDELKEKIEDSHYYTIEINLEDYGYCNIDITY